MLPLLCFSSYSSAALAQHLLLPTSVSAASLLLLHPERSVFALAVILSAAKDPEELN
jgi:hypothetical protein